MPLPLDRPVVPLYRPNGDFAPRHCMPQCIAAVVVSVHLWHHTHRERALDRRRQPYCVHKTCSDANTTTKKPHSVSARVTVARTTGPR